MTLKEWIKKHMLERQGVVRENENPNSPRLTFISDPERLKIDEVRANRVWYLGDGNELLNYYTQRQAIGFASNPIYNRNKRNYFWSLSASECDIKRVHSGIPNMIITTITNVVGAPSIECFGWDDIAEANDFSNKLVQQGRPLTLAEGWGAWKVNINPELSSEPLWEYYEAENVDYVYKAGLLIGITFSSYYKDAKNNDYVLLESRFRAHGNSYIEYHLFLLDKNDGVIEVSKDKLPELGTLEDFVLYGYNHILAVPSRYFFDPMNVNYGKSIYAGKLDLFDMLDEIWSQASQTNRVSTPVEYYNPDVLDRRTTGQAGMPNLYNRQFVQKTGVPDGEGNLSDDIITTQPELNFDKYGRLSRDTLDYILTGVLSPASLGIDLSKRDNADAQREKEKITLVTRNNIIAPETVMLRKIVNISLDVKEYMQTGHISNQGRSINIKYNEFANPSFENQIQILGISWVNGEISTPKYVDLLWGDRISEEEKQKEIIWLDENRSKMEYDLPTLFNQARTVETAQDSVIEDDV